MDRFPPSRVFFISALMAALFNLGAILQGNNFFSLMIFPFLMPEFLKQSLQFSITPEFMAHMALQNSQLLKQGFIKAGPIKEFS